MDLLLLIGIATSLLVILVTIYIFSSKGSKEEKKEAPVKRNVPVRVQDDVPRRAQILRNQRNRARVAIEEPQAEQDEDDDEDDDGIPKADVDYGAEKMGAKKRAKLEAKAEKKVQREQELKIREEQKKKDALADKERQKQEEKDREEERKRVEAEQNAREEQERKEYEEYLKMKEAFSVEEEGFEEGESGDAENMLQEFINYIKNNKVVILEDLAGHFQLKAQAAIDRIVDLQKEGRLSGVIDDRGKFIYISEDELKAVAKFIKQRGRVSIAELAESSNSLINLATPIEVGN